MKFKKLFSLFLVTVFTLGFVVKANASGVNSIVNSFNTFYSYSHSTYSEGGGSVDLNNYNVSLEGTPIQSLPVWGQVNFSKSFSNGDQNYNNEFYGAKLGYDVNVNRNFAIIPNIGYEYFATHSSDNNYNELDNMNQVLLGVKVYTTPTSNLWFEGQVYYQHSQGAKYVISGVSNSLKDNSGYEVGVKVGYIVYKTNYTDISPFGGINYESVGVGDSTIGIFGADLGIKVGF